MREFGSACKLSWPLLRYYASIYNVGHPVTCLCRHRGIAPNSSQPRRSNRVMWSAVRSGRFISGKDPVPILHERRWASGLVFDGTENLAAPGFEPWTVHPVASRYTVYAILTAVYTVGTEVNLVVQTDIGTQLPKRMMIATRIPVLSVVVWYDPVQYWAYLLLGYDAASVGNRTSTFRDSLCPQPRGSKCPTTWNLDVSTPKNKNKNTALPLNVGMRLRSDGISATSLRNAQNTHCTTCCK